MKKITIEFEIFKKIDYQKPIPFSAIKDIVQDDDIIIAGYDEGFFSENDSMDAHYYMSVNRKRLESDEEFNARQASTKEQKEYLKKKRYESYLQLKKEFE